MSKKKIEAKKVIKVAVISIIFLMTIIYCGMVVRGVIGGLLEGLLFSMFGLLIAIQFKK